MTTPRPYYTAAEIAHFLGIDLAWFHHVARREVYHTRDRLPRPYVGRPMRFDKASIDAWRSRYHPVMAALGEPANDRQPAAPDRAALADVYRR